MKRFAIVGLAFALIIAIVFAMTVISEMTGGGDAPKPNGTGEKKAIGSVFDFRSTACNYDPSPEAPLQNRYFRGFFEEGDEGTVSFWFVNRSPEPITVSAEASCVSCSGARIANVSDKQLDDYAKTVAVGGFVPGVGFDPFALAAALTLDRTTAWQTFDIKGVNAPLTLPGTKTAAGNGQGLVQVRLKASRGSSPTPMLTLHANTANEPKQKYELKTQYTFVPGAFAIRPTKFDFGELSDANPKKTVELIVWSPIRPFGERFPPQALKVSEEGTPLEIGAAERLTRTEMEGLAEKLSVEMKGAARVAAAYRFKLTYHRERNGTLTEIGPFEKLLEVAGTDNARTSVPLTGSNVGFLRLRDEAKFDFGTFDASFEKVVHGFVVSDRTDHGLEAMPGETKPRFLKVQIGEPTTEDGRRTWKLTIRIEPRAGFGTFPANAVVTLRTTGANPVVLRIPVAGNGTRR